MRLEEVEADVLCVGGGIAGLMAAIRAAEQGARVVIAEKGVTRFSGAGRGGNDHFQCYLPELHGDNMDAFIDECMKTQLGALLTSLSRSVIRTWLARSREIVLLWESWGIPMRRDGQWYCSGHSFPGGAMTHVKYHGKQQKIILTERALGAGARIMDRMMVFDVTGDERGVTGALAIHTREDRFIHFRAPVVILGTGRVERLFPGVTPELMGNSMGPFTCTGDGRAMAYRAGAELVNFELLARHAGVKNYIRAGQATWTGVCRDPEGRPIGKYLQKPDPRYGDIILEVDKQIIERYRQAGKGPVYMDCTGLSAEDIGALHTALEDEANIGILKHFKEEGIDLARNGIEFQTYQVRMVGFVNATEKAETTVPGLYSIGDECAVGISGAAVFGWIAGEQAVQYARSHNTTESRAAENDAGLEAGKAVVESLEGRRKGFEWRDANFALQHIMADYCGQVRSQHLLEAGLAHLRRLRVKVDGELIARNRWELTRCLEVRNLCELGELAFLTALQRTESRGMHQRSDYPYTDPLLTGKLLYVRQEAGKPEMVWRSLSK